MSAEDRKAATVEHVCITFERSVISGFCQIQAQCKHRGACLFAKERCEVFVLFRIEADQFVCIGSDDPVVQFKQRSLELVQELATCPVKPIEFFPCDRPM